jgi:hypothetical protein
VTYAPASIKAAQVYLHAVTGLPWVSLGIVGDENHRGGYHQGEPNVPASDYSRDESARDENGLTGAASALDIGNFTKGGKTLRGMSLWIVAQCAAGAPDTRDIREVIYSPDGQTVKRWDRLGRRSSGDSSHLTHTHISYHRDSERRDKVGLFKRFFEGAASPAAPVDGVPAGVLREGDTGPDVGLLQTGLNEAINAGLEVDEDFGPATTAAVRELQRRAGITIDGIYGDNSADALRDLLEDDMSWNEKIDLITGQGVSYSGEEWPASFVLSSSHYYTLKYGQEIVAEQKAARLREEAILAAVKGIDSKSILAKIDQRAAEEASRDAAAAQRDAEILALVQQVGTGQLAADEVVARIGELLTGAGA